MPREQLKAEMRAAMMTMARWLAVLRVVPNLSDCLTVPKMAQSRASEKPLGGPRDRHWENCLGNLKVKQRAKEMEDSMGMTSVEQMAAQWETMMVALKLTGCPWEMRVNLSSSK